MPAGLRYGTAQSGAVNGTGVPTPRALMEMAAAQRRGQVVVLLGGVVIGAHRAGLS
ncbi:hypothetical protein ABZ897_44080 [Nonomuraea sp. NPDC046802]|uniref:hypothetical protein n=1 Tax=Nonomuraea sp. NPDC046802 TaxID=3154919 RepID=UPI0033CC3123